nr:glycosyl hydrolase [Prolixibacteraceae bacterium]
RRWLDQVDSVAFYLKQLQDAKVPVLWRPYHEMNGNWFWWGGRTEGKFTTKALYQALFDRYVHHHRLTNLIWEWSVDRISRTGMEYDLFYPGNETIDILALDVYGSDFSQRYYDELKKLSEGKPLVLGEVGNPPSREVMDAQPDWAYWVVWAGMVRNTTQKQYREYIDDPKVLFQGDEAWLPIINSFRQACRLPEIDKEKNPFSGIWIFNESFSRSADGFAQVPAGLDILQIGNELMIERTFAVEWAEDRFTHETLVVSDQETETPGPWGGKRYSRTSFAADGSIVSESRIVFDRDGARREMKSSENWTLSSDGNELIIIQKSESQRGINIQKLVYNKEELTVQ